MKNKKNWLITILAMMMVISGCGSKAADEGNGSGDKQAAEGGQVTIELFNQKTEIKGYIDQIIKDFEAENPNIKVKHVQVPDSRQVLYNRMASNDTPDIMSIFPNESDFKKQAESDYFMDLTGTDVIANVEPMYLEDGKVNGKDYGVPLTMNAYGVYYNVTKFEELGLKVPTTWAELEETAKAIKEKDLIPFATSFKEGWTTGHLTEALFMNIAGPEAAQKFFEDPSAKAADDANIQKLISQMDFIREYSQADAAGNGYNDAVNLFATSQALMMPQGIWAVPVVEQAGMEDEYKMFPFPNDSGKGIAVGGIDYALAISADTKYPEETKKFVKFMTEQKTAQYLADNDKSPSTIKGVEVDFPKTADLTKLISEEGRFSPWIHFSWKAGLDASWGTETSGYLIMKDKAAFESWIDKDFGKK